MKNRTLLTHWPTTTLTILPEAIGGEGGREGSVAPHPPSTKNLGGRAAAFKCQKHFYECICHPIDIACDIDDFRSNIFCPQTTQQQHKKHHEARPPEQLTDVLWQIEVVTVKLWKKFACAKEQRNGSGGWVPFSRLKRSAASVKLKKFWKNSPAATYKYFVDEQLPFLWNEARQITKDGALARSVIENRLKRCWIQYWRAN